MIARKVPRSQGVGWAFLEFFTLHFYDPFAVKSSQRGWRHCTSGGHQVNPAPYAEEQEEEGGGEKLEKEEEKKEKKNEEEKEEEEEEELDLVARISDVGATRVASKREGPVTT
uniref:Uncharacterized protein n=1 Tax=Vespula pensylvanica TaxID=30213 RepID=A0A834U7P3_VESPE|nr:hypothetical protein H0235_010438 [Vespula pensylvanica]